MAFVSETTRGSGLFSALTAALSNLGDSWNRYRVFRTTYAELSALSDRELNDLGYGRSMITRLAYESAYGKNA